MRRSDASGGEDVACLGMLPFSYLVPESRDIDFQFPFPPQALSTIDEIVVKLPVQFDLAAPPTA